MTVDFENLREANLDRQPERTGAEQADIAFRALEVADECGEVAGAVKKLVRAQRGICGSTMTLADVADEIGDAIIALDLLACDLCLAALVPSDADAWVERSAVEITLRLDEMGGELSGAVLRYLSDQAAIGDAARQMEDIECGVSEMLGLLLCLALALGVDAGRAVAAKFNKTSARYGLTTLMAVE